MASPTADRRLPVGADVVSSGVRFRVWAPQRRRVEVIFDGDSSSAALTPEGDGYFSAHVAAARTGMLYRFRLDGEATLYPDPASRFQPQGPHGPSEIIDPSAFTWTDRAWRGAGLAGQVIYEMHIGAFTAKGTWEAAARELPELADLGATVIEVMPIADFAGRFGWGYDGVNLFAPTRLYGRPDDFRRFVDRAHAAGLGVILDVVYNHFGPDGAYLGAFSKDYFTDRYKNEWGEAINFDGPSSSPVREYFIANAGYWIEEFHIDGLRLDATQQIFDTSAEHILTAVGRKVREAARGRATLIVAENEPQDVRIVRPIEKGGIGLDGLWNDDFHHSAVVALTGRNEAYYTDYHGGAQELVSAVKYGYIYQGQRYQWQKQRRGTAALDVAPQHFVTFLENHDQVANSARGCRLHRLSGPGRLRALTALTLLAPGTPMLFMGQEFAASSPFLFFADHNEKLARLVRQGRAEFLKQFPSLVVFEQQAALADPSDPHTFERCKLDFTERQSHAEWYALHRDLLKLRRHDPVFHAQKPRGLDGAVLAPEAFVLRFFGDGGDDRLLLVNLGRNLHLDPAPEPLLAPPENRVWQILWSSEHPRYGGDGTAPLDMEENWRLPGHAAVALSPRPAPAEEGPKRPPLTGRAHK
ncbi:MAG TPA: malto-oligosyltrehalose trehalohydrolase [Gemmataceae bacterium]|nr:malto-oligosyltrehalose trehalohydrolase [Gemmataceae bacterium]